MATGDTAAAAGLEVFASTQDHGLGYDNDNVRGDELGDHILNGGHAWGKITGKPSLYTQAQVNSLLADNAEDSTDYTNGHVASAIGVLTSPASSAHADGVSADAFNRTAASASRVPVYMDAALNLGKNTSSRRYKENITDAGLEPESLRLLRPVTFTRRGDLEPVLELGLIAEEVAELGLELLVVRDDEGRPDGVRYDVLAVALLDQLADVERRLADAEATIRELAAPTTPQEV